MKSLRCAAFALILALLASPALAARQKAVLIPVAISGDNTASILGGALDRAISERMSDRFDIRILTVPADYDPSSALKKAGSSGSPYVIEGSVVRIGKAISLELRVLPAEQGSPGKTVVASAIADPADESPTGGGMPPVYRRLITEATANLKLRFFGDDRFPGGRKIPGLAGTLTRSAVHAGNPVSVALADSDRDGLRELIVAFPNEIAIYRIDGDELVEKARIADAGPSLLRIDAADLDRNGVAEIIAVRVAGGKPISDIWAFDGKEYRKFVTGLPWFLGCVEIENEGTVLLGQESDAQAIFKGPIFRIAVNRYGQGEVPDKGRELPLPADTGIYDVGTVKTGSERLFVVLGKGGIPALYDRKGNVRARGADPINGTEVGMPAFGGADEPVTLLLPPRLFATNLDGNGTEALLAVNNLATPGAFFENVKIQSGAEVMSFALDGDALRLAWRTSQTLFGVRDAFVLEEGSSRNRRIGLVVREKGKLLDQQSEWRIVWMR